MSGQFIIPLPYPHVLPKNEFSVSIPTLFVQDREGVSTRLLVGRDSHRNALTLH